MLCASLDHKDQTFLDNEKSNTSKSYSAHACSENDQKMFFILLFGFENISELRTSRHFAWATSLSGTQEIELKPFLANLGTHMRASLLQYGWRS
jgi:hypothetical protein